MGAGEVVAMGRETRVVESNAQLGFGFAQPASTGEVEPAPREERFLSGAEGDFFVGEQGLAEYMDANQQGWVLKLKVLVSELDYSPFYGRYKDDGGRRPIHPRVMLGLIAYGITQGKMVIARVGTAGANGFGRAVDERPGAARSQHDWQVHSVARAVAERAVLHDVGEAASPQAASERGHGGHGRYRDRRGRQSLPHATYRGAARGRAKRAGRADFDRAPGRTGASRPRRCGDAARAARARGDGAADQAWALTPKLQTVGAAPRKWAGDRAGGACEQRDRGGDGLVATAPGGVRG